MTYWAAYLMPKTLSIRNPPKKQRTTLGQEYQAYSCMNSLVFRFRSWCSQGGNMSDKSRCKKHRVFFMCASFNCCNYHADLWRSCVRRLSPARVQWLLNVNCCIPGTAHWCKTESELPGWLEFEVQLDCHNRSSFLEQKKKKYIIILYIRWYSIYLTSHESQQEAALQPFF